jgi:hypothetical protein
MSDRANKTESTTWQPLPRRTWVLSRIGISLDVASEGPKGKDVLVVAEHENRSQTHEKTAIKEGRTPVADHAVLVEHARDALLGPVARPQLPRPQQAHPPLNGCSVFVLGLGVSRAGLGFKAEPQDSRKGRMASKKDGSVYTLRRTRTAQAVLTTCDRTCCTYLRVTHDSNVSPHLP